MINIFCNHNDKQIEQFIFDCFNHYFDGRLKRDIDVDIIFKSELDCSAAGWCTGDKQEILIELDNTYTGRYLYLNIAHEIIHAKQFLRGETSDQELMEQEALDGENELVELYL